MVSRRFRNRVNLSGAFPEAVATRIETLEDSDGILYRDDLALVAERSDTYDRRIRLAAIGKLEHLPVLARLLDGTSEIAQAAAASIARLIASNPAHTYDALLTSPSVKMAFIRASRDPIPVQEMLSELEIEQLVDLAGSAAHVSVRLAAAKRVQDEGALTIVANKAKQRDKNVFRLARTRLDRIRAARRAIKEAQQRASNIANRLSELSESPTDRTFAPRLKIIQQEWQECLTVHSHALESAPQLASEFPELFSADIFSRSMQRAESRLALKQTPEAQASEGREPLLAPPETEAPAARESTPTSAKDLAFLESTLSRPPPKFESPESVEDYKALWREFDRLERVDRRLANSVQELHASSDPAQPELAQSVQSWRDDYAVYRESGQVLQAKLLTTFETEFKQLTEQIELGKLGAATLLRRTCCDALRELPEHRARNLWKKLHEMDSGIQQMRDWQSYAATPKREALCDSMAKLAETPVEIIAQVDQIRALRDEWKALGPLTGGRDHELRRRFEKLADAAFAPCKSYFQEQAELRKRNLTTRRQLCADLETFLADKDWNNPDFKALDRILRTARSEWRAAYPVDRAKVKALQGRFDGLCDDIYTRLSSRWKSHELKARGLIVELRALLDSTSSVERLAEGTSAIQTRWREIGPMSHSANRKLWKEFRGLCDQVYSQRRGRRDQENEAFRDKLERARQLLTRLETALQEATPESASTGELTRLEEEWEPFKDSPGEAFKRLNNGWKDLSKRYRHLLREGDLSRQLHLLDLAKQLDASLCAAEQALLDSRGPPDDSLLETLVHDTKSLFGKLPLARLDALRHGAAPGLDEIQTRVTERRRMCITLDIHADRESPQEDKALRLQIQVNRINKGAGSSRELKKEPVSIARDWCQIGPVGTQGDALHARFFGALAQMTE